MRIALVSDAWAPQVNGVVRTLATTVDHARRRGHDVEMLTPDQFATLPCPSYPEIRLAVGAGGSLRRRLDRFGPTAVHIATEGPLGWSARRWCRARGLPFTTSFHTRFPDYLSLRTRLPAKLFWPVARRFHGGADTVFVATDTLESELHGQRLLRTHRWARGVDTKLFTPKGPHLPALADLPRPILLSVGRVAVEKNLDAFLSLDVAGSKVVVGDGPALAGLRARYPDVLFLGTLSGEPLAAAYRTADVLVFPSRTDTFGLVMVEAMACGTPVAAFPVQGPLDVLGGSSHAGSSNGGTAGTSGGALDADLATAIERALKVDDQACLRAASRFDWAACTSQFLAGLAPFGLRRTARGGSGSRHNGGCATGDGFHAVA